MTDMRRANDFYPTPVWATKILLEHIGPRLGRVLEPCVGAGHISRAIEDSGKSDRVVTNDIDRQYDAHRHVDATTEELFSRGEYDWIISNPPFEVAMPIVRHAVENTRRGVAMLLRLSFLEPTLDRGPWLAVHPPDKTLILPRISFTGDGKTDSVTTAWFIWDTWQCNGQRLEVIPRRAPQESFL